MKKSMIGILSGIGIVAVVTTAIAVPLSLKSDDYVVPGKTLKNTEITTSKEYELFVTTFKAQTLGITGVDIVKVNDSDKNLIVIATGTNKASDDVKAIFNVDKATGKTTILKIEKGPSGTETKIEDALKKNAVLNASKMKIATTKLAERIKAPDMISVLPDEVIEVIKTLEDNALDALVTPTKKSSLMTKAEVVSKLKIVLTTTNNKHWIEEHHITITPDDETGSMTIDVTGVDGKTFSVTGFLTNAAAEILAAKTTAIEEINALSYPEQDDALHDASLFGAIASAEVAAKIAINNAASTADVSTVLAVEKTKIGTAISSYNASTGTAKILELQIAAKKMIDQVSGANLNLPNANLQAYSFNIDKPNNGVTSSGVNFIFTKWEFQVTSIYWEAILSLEGQSKTIDGTITSFKSASTPQSLAEFKTFLITETKKYYNDLLATLTEIAEEKKANLPSAFKEKSAWIDIATTIDEKINNGGNAFVDIKNAQKTLEESIQTAFNVYDFVIRMANGEFNKVMTGDFKIPVGVTWIPISAFKDATLPTGFLIPEGVLCINGNAFENAILPVGFNLPSTLTTINNYAFQNTILPENFNLPQGIKWIGIGVFWKATIPTGFVIPNGITKLCAETFSESILPADFRLPATIKAIGSYAFYKVNLPEGFAISAQTTLIEFEAFAGATFNGDFVLPRTVTSIAEFAFASIEIKKTFTIQEGTTRIFARVFYKTIFPVGFNLPTSINAIDKQAFALATLPTNFELPTNLKSIGDYVFVLATLPAGFEIPSGATISSNSFKNSKLPLLHKWFDKNDVLLADQTKIISGCIVKTTE